MHRDHVPTLPPGFLLLGYSPVCAVQGFVLRYPDSEAGDIAGKTHIFAVQGHPEFLPGIVHKIVDAREASGVMDASTVAMGRSQAGINDDGVDVIGKAIWRILGVE